LGLLLVFPFDLLVAFVPEGVEPLGGLPVAWIVGGPLAALLLAALDDWVVRREFPKTLAGLGLITLAINLLAAGSLIFSGVMTTAWVLAAIATKPGEGDEVRQPMGNAAHSIAILSAAVLVYLAHQSLYSPTLTSQVRQAEFVEARAQGQLSSAQVALEKWIAADPWSAEPWRSRAELELERWLSGMNDDDGKAFHEAVSHVVELSPHAARQAEQKAQWYWVAWRRKQDTSCRDLAVAAWREAVMRYPNSGFLRAQLAWVLADVGELDEAKQQAERARALDAQNPHREQKLVNRKVFDPLPDAQSPYRSESADESLEAILSQ
jgi:tetratricopeptide (TPR) repeat protein